jgi:hypothetical protein
MLAAMILATSVAHSAPLDPTADRQREIDMAFDQYSEARSDTQRGEIIDYLQHLDKNLVTGTLIGHIIASRDGIEATAYDKLAGDIGPEAFTAIIDRLGKSDDPVAKGKLIVALRHSPDGDSIHALIPCLDDKRPVPFEARGEHPRRVCDLAYDELFLKLRSNPLYGLDPSPQMHGIITERTSLSTRDTLISALKTKLTQPTGSPSPTPTPMLQDPISPMPL